MMDHNEYTKMKRLQREGEWADIADYCVYNTYTNLGLENIAGKYKRSMLKRNKKKSRKHRK